MFHVKRFFSLVAEFFPELFMSRERAEIFAEIRKIEASIVQRAVLLDPEDVDYHELREIKNLAGALESCDRGLAEL